MTLKHRGHHDHLVATNETGTEFKLICAGGRGEETSNEVLSEEQIKWLQYKHAAALSLRQAIMSTSAVAADAAQPLSPSNAVQDPETLRPVSSPPARPSDLCSCSCLCDQGSDWSNFMWECGGEDDFDLIKFLDDDEAEKLVLEYTSNTLLELGSDLPSAEL